jgi:hypothetical protein
LSPRQSFTRQGVERNFVLYSALGDLEDVYSLCLQNIPIDLQPLKSIDFYLLFWLAQQRLLTVLSAPMCKTSAQLRLKNRHRLASS